MTTPRLRIFFLVLAVCILAVCILAACDMAGGGEAFGRSLVVVDGDTVIWHGQRYDLSGIDAPELGQRCMEGRHIYDCGLDAAFALDKRVRLERTECALDPRDHAELLCRVGGTSLGDLQLSDGHAFARTDASQSLLLAEEGAKTAHLGVWRGTHVDPQDWLTGDRLPAETKNASTCPVIVVASQGDIYFVVPTDDEYQDVAKSGRGTRYCSDEAAVSAGARHLLQRR